MPIALSPLPRIFAAAALILASGFNAARADEPTATATPVEKTAVEELAKGARGAAFTYAKTIVPRAMKNPKSAEFDWDAVKVEWTKKGRVNAEEVHPLAKVSGIVRGTNSFNAVVPQPWEMLLVFKEDVWEPAVVQLEGKVVFTSDDGVEMLKAAEEKKEQQRREAMKSMEEKSRRESRLKNAAEQGRNAGRDAIVRNKWTNRVADVNIRKAAKKAAEQSEFANDDNERTAFEEAFVGAVKAAKQ